jgi:hypothetical protein
VVRGRGVCGSESVRKGSVSGTRSLIRGCTSRPGTLRASGSSRRWPHRTTRRPTRATDTFPASRCLRRRRLPAQRRCRNRRAEKLVRSDTSSPLRRIGPGPRRSQRSRWPDRSSRPGRGASCTSPQGRRARPRTGGPRRSSRRWPPAPRKCRSSRTGGCPRNPTRSCTCRPQRRAPRSDRRSTWRHNSPCCTGARRGTPRPSRASPSPSTRRATAWHG